MASRRGEAQDVGRVALPPTPVGHRVGWLLRQLSRAAPPASDEELQANITADDPKDLLDRLASTLEGFDVVDVTASSETELTVRVACPNGREWEMTCTVAAAAPHPIGRVGLERALPPGMDVRPAGPDDNDAILEVSRQTPVVLGDTSVTIDLGPDFFAYVRLMEKSLVMVATDDGAVVGVHCGGTYPVRMGGQLYRMGMVQHSRILPDYGRLGLWGRMNSHLGRAGASAPNDGDGPPPPLATGAYIGLENEAAHRLARNSWSCRPFRVTLPCRRAATSGAEPFRRATPDDAEEIVRIINACHDHEELFFPYTVASLAARLTRAPDLYSWSNVMIGKGAVAGVWHAGQQRTRMTADGPTTSIRGLVLDYGFLPGYEDELASVLESCCHEGARRGMTHLSIFTSAPSPGSALVRSLGDDTEVYELVTPRTLEPEGTDKRGVYVDQIYF